MPLWQLTCALCRLLAPAATLCAAGAVAAAPAHEPVSWPATEPATVDRLRFQPFDEGLPTRGQWRNGFDVADINGDGHPDIVHGPPRKAGGPPRIFLGDGQGRWRLWTEAHFPRAPYDYGDIAAADFNGDGHADLALTAHLRGIILLLGDGKGRFAVGASPTDFEPDPGKAFTSRAILAHDWNRDGRIDLIALGEGPKPVAGASGSGFSRSAYGWVAYLNQESGMWQKVAQPGDVPLTFGDSLALGDFDRDGLTDLVTASLVHGNAHVFHRGTGSGEAQAWPPAPIPAPAYIRAVATADFDGDARDDVVLSYTALEGRRWFTAIDVLLARDEDGWERRAVTVREDRGGIFALASGDVDGDGRRDFAALTADGGLWLFLGRGDGSFERAASGELGGLGNGCRGYRVRLADLDGDGRDEIIAAFAGESSAPGGHGCPGGGRLTAWKAVARTPPAPTAER